MGDTLLGVLNSGMDFFRIYVFDPIRNITFIDVLDIILLAVIFYQVYRFTKERRAGKLAMGLLLVLGAMALTALLNMRAIQFIFRNFTQVGLIAIVIVFQPELRAALEKFGGAPLT